LEASLYQATEFAANGRSAEITIMSTYKAWAAKQRGNPIMLLIGVIGIVGGCYIGYAKIWAPFRRRQKLARAEIYGNYIYEQEKRKHE